MRDVAGKVAFITGAGGGVGYGMAKAFLAAGMKVVLSDASRDNLREVADELGQHGGAAHYLIADVTDPAAMHSAAEESVRVLGKVHVLCNNVGVHGQEPIDTASLAEWRRVFETNFFGMVNGLNAFLPKIKSHGEGGHIVNTACVTAILPIAGPMGVYCTSKFAVRGFSDSLRLTLAPQNIGVSVLCPGMVKSRTLSAMQAEQGAHSAIGDETEGEDQMGEAMTEALDQLAVGEAVLRGVRNDDGYILTHSEFAAETHASFREIMACFPRDDETISASRRHFADERRQMSADVRARIRNLQGE